MNLGFEMVRGWRDYYYEMVMMKGVSSGGRFWKSGLICGVVAVGAMFGSLLWLTASVDSPLRILVDTDVDTDDVTALLYLLKQPSSLFRLQAITINGNGWSNGGHAVNHLYDMLFMMGRDDIPIGVGGEGGISPNATISAHVGGYLPLVDQGVSTAGQCRYRQAIPVGEQGRLYADTNFGLRRAFLPQGTRRYIPMKQPTAQQVMKDAISAGPTTVFVMGAHTNLAIFLMTNPHLKKNIKHIYAMGGAIRQTCSPNADKSHGKTCNNIGNLWPPNANPYAEFNIFGDPFAAYTVLHSGIPITLVPLDATSTIPVDKKVYLAFEQRQNTYEAKYCFRSLKMAHDTWSGGGFFEMYSMWDSFMVGVALSQMLNLDRGGGNNAYSKMEYLNISIVTSNEPYGISDGSNPLVDGRLIPKFGVQKNGVHSGHVQTGMLDPFCLVSSEKGKCKDGYTKEAEGSESVEVLVAVSAKSSLNTNIIDKAFYLSFLDAINSPRQSGRFDFRAQFPKYKEVLYRPKFGKNLLGKPVIFDMDMSTGDFLTLLYLLKTPVEIIDLKGIIISPNGWATAATIDVVYDVLHMMGRDDISVGLGDVFAIGEAHPSFPSIGDCKYIKAIPHGSGGFLDSDTLYGFARDLPRSPRRYTAENSVKIGAFRDTDHPGLRQMSAVDVWTDIVQSLDPEVKITVLTNGPLTNLAQIIRSKAISSRIQEVYITGGHISSRDKGNVFTIPSNEYAEFNFFLDPTAAELVLGSGLNITLIPLNTQRNVSSFSKILEKLKHGNITHEARFARRLLFRLYRLQQKYPQYHHVDMFLGEVLGAVSLGGRHQNLKEAFSLKAVKVITEGGESKVGQTIIDEKEGKWVRVLESVEALAFYEHLANALADQNQTAVIGSFEEQKALWSA
ncbi:uncharacterized protein LOC111441054 isoform X2 [Cucurbita moschata]|uniref:Uncharacterized protein LOC111441054 isoform X1 n=2 Tax=Cucurbita moschata TaxID=3662 RepID=A0A6J1EZU7_CUCMO|nr:uncharacterized protein LOC111441054 isoform X1 [Cucurbita moschata]XP_022933722.1 uncharacterized protein LOC111441054 isoform X2 [Cucurbita moschata]